MIRRISGRGIRLSVRKNKRPTMSRREHVEYVRGNKGGGMGPDGRYGSCASARAWLDGLHQAWFTDGDMDKTIRRVEKGRIRYSSDAPLVACRSRADVDLH